MPNLLYYFNPKTATITTLISQYELLLSLCDSLSSADIIHLAATCKAHWTYIASSKPTLSLLKSKAVCDGKGIVTRTQAFGYARDDVLFEDLPCLDADVQPCVSCRAHVCNNCRFHFVYSKGIFYRDKEAQYVEELQNDAIGEHVYPEWPSIQAKRAFDVYWRTSNRTRRYCLDCHPTVLPTTDRSVCCKCSLYECFLGSRWLCLPYFFVEEAIVHGERSVRIHAYEEGTWVGHGVNRGYLYDFICYGCGKTALKKSFEFCRRCEGVTGWFRDTENILRGKVKDVASASNASDSA